MYSFTVALLCVQAYLVQNVLSQCLGNFGPAAISSAAALTPAAYGSAAAFAAGPYGYRAGVEPAYSAAGIPGSYPVASLGPYGGTGEGNVGVAGELPLVGTTALNGQVPIMGAVNFGGSIPALGGVSITGNCACGCGAGIPYMY